MKTKRAEAEQRDSAMRGRLFGQTIRAEQAAAELDRAAQEKRRKAWRTQAATKAPHRANAVDSVARQAFNSTSDDMVHVIHFSRGRSESAMMSRKEADALRLKRFEASMRRMGALV